VKRSPLLTRRTPLAPGKPLARRTELARGTTPLRPVSEKKAAQRLGVVALVPASGIVRRPGRREPGNLARSAAEAVPLAVRWSVHLRDSWCVHCGSPHGLHVHHRRVKGIGGDPRPHTDCCCNCVLLCWLCHDWAHTTGRAEAEEEGLIIPAAETRPWLMAVLVHTESDGFTAWPKCAGQWTMQAPGGAA